MTTSRPHDAAHASSTSPTFARPARYEAAVLSDLSEAMAIVAREAPNGLATPFQTELWLNAWRKVYAGDASEIETMFIVARAMHAEHQDGALAMILPVTRQRHEGLLFISSFDAGVTDYNAPILGPAAPSDSADARRMWRAIKLALPPADVIEIVKSPFLKGHWEARGFSDRGRIHPQARIDYAMKDIDGDWLVTGIATAAELRVEKVEVSFDDGGIWEEAAITSERLPDSWCTWKLKWKPRTRGEQILCARVICEGGERQIESNGTAFPSGSTGLHRVRVNVV